ncbi:MAG: iron-containing alcohol dehydrogenase [Succinatimonas sp.]|nr:iron-containing alcohol dehydrogenase [Succinatimonas sp.]
MNDFTLLDNTQMYFGRGKEFEVGKLVKFYGGSRTLIIYNDEISQIPGLLDKVKRALDLSGIEFVELGGVKNNPRLFFIEDGVATCIKYNVDFILAIGNAYCFSAAKAIAAAVYHPAQIKDIFDKDFLLDEALPIGAIVTVPGCGFVNSGYMSAVIPKSDGSFRMLSRDNNLLRPRFAILNPELVNNSKQELVSSLISISARVFERYLAPHPAQVLTDRIYESVMATIFSMWQHLRDIPGDYEAYANIMWSGIMTNIIPSIENSAENPALEQVKRGLVSLYDCSRAEALSLILPAYLEMSIAKNPQRIALMGNRAFSFELDFQHPENTCYLTLKRLRQFISQSGLPKTFEDLGGSGADIPKLLELIDMSSGGLLSPGVKFDKTGVEILLSLILIK